MWLLGRTAVARSEVLEIKAYSSRNCYAAQQVSLRNYSTEGASVIGSTMEFIGCNKGTQNTKACLAKQISRHRGYYQHLVYSV